MSRNICNLTAKQTVTALSVALLTVVLYLPALEYDFVNWDDDNYVYENINIRTLDAQSIQWMFTAFHSANWHPVTWLSHAADYAVWGLNPMGHHLTSIILHGINTFLVAIFVMRLVPSATLPLIAGAITALLFGIHPLHVESVAWVSERKDLLCALFFLLSLLSYLGYAGYLTNSGRSAASRRSQYGLCLLFFIFALLSKPMAVTLPFVLIILDIYPLQRLGAAAPSSHLINSILGNKAGSDRPPSAWVAVLGEKLPFFALSAASSAITIMAQNAAHALVPIMAHPLEDRVWTAVRALFFYLAKMIWPANLAPLYPIPYKLSINAEHIGSLLSGIGITALCIYLWFRHRKVFLSAWVYYVLCLLPVLGIVQVGGQSAAARYTYLPLLSPFLLIGLAVALQWKRNDLKSGESIKNKLPILLPVMIILAVLSHMTVNQMAIWKDSISLWSAELAQFPSTHTSYERRALAYEQKGDYGNAIADLKKSISINSMNPNTYHKLGVVYRRSDSSRSAFENFIKATDLYPGFKEAVQAKEATYNQLLGEYSKKIQLNPGREALFTDRGTIHAMMNNLDQALADYTTAIHLNPQNPTAYHNRGLLFIETAEYKKAIADFDSVIRLNAGDAQAYFSRGTAHEKAGDAQEAIRDFQISARNGYAKARDYLSKKGTSR